MSHSIHHGKLRLGKMARWQKWASYIFLVLSIFTGLIWFILADICDQLPGALRPWWVSHGVTSMICLLIIGAAMPQHILVTWRAKRNRGGGLLAAVVLSILIMTSLLLFYGAESLHDQVRLIHVTLGLLLILVFPWHIIRGRKSVAQLQRIKAHA